MTAISRTQVNGFEAVVLENPLLRAVVIPELGGRVWELEDRLRSRQWIWHRPGVPLKASRIGEAYDDVWAGGWEELFPNDAPAVFEGRTLPDHGEWWTRPWRVTHLSGGAEARLELTTSCAVVRATCTKEFTLAAGTGTLQARYVIRSEEPEPFHFLFKQHLPIELSPACRLVMPGGCVEAVDPEFGTRVRTTAVFPWPGAACDTDLRVIPASSSNAREFVYVRELPEGWCGVTDTRAGASLRLTFDSDVFPFVWLFMSYGGWRQVYTAVLEPCTNQPKDLAEAVRLGQSAALSPGGEFRTTVAITLGPDREFGRVR
jgi:hypothetical protein